jgi:uncharacterized membrane protein HdeD (DUF308 family)
MNANEKNERMSTSITADHTENDATSPRRIAVARAVLALLWAAAVVIAVGDDVPRTTSDVPGAAAVLLAAYPLIDAVASLLAAGRAGTTGRVLRLNAAVSTLAAVAVGVAAFGSDAGATLTAFGAWAAVSGALQLGVAIRRRSEGRQLPMMISGGLSTVAGLSFVAAAGKTDAHLATLGGYMALGAVLYLVWAARSTTARQAVADGRAPAAR